MTTPQSAAPIHNRVQQMKRQAIERDVRMMTIQMVRAGKPELLFPDLFNDTWKKSIVANTIDSVARDFAEMIAPLPALNCSSRAMKTNADKAKAQKKNIIGTHIWRESKLAGHMYSFADAYLSYGFAPLYAEPDYERSMPMIRAEDPRGFYYENDRYGRTLRTAKCYKEPVSKVAAMFPELAARIVNKPDQYGNWQPCGPDETIEIVRYCDDKQWVMYLPERANMVLVTYDNPIGRCPFAVAERPGLFGEPIGQYDGVIWVQLARHRMALLGLEAGVKAVGAPLAVPRDMVEIAIGPDSVLQTDNPDKIRRVGIEVPNSTFALQDTLEKELRIGARYPEGRNGGMDASVITGRGVQALMGSFDTQVQTAQKVIGEALAKATEFAFEMDCKIWPTRDKRITGNSQGEPYDLTYRPSRDIGDNWTCDVTYGFAAGLAPNAATVMMLQLRGDGLIDRSTVRKHLPFDIDDERMQRAMDVESTADALKQGLNGLLQGLGPMAAQGLDPRPYLRAAATIIHGRQNGKELEQLFIDAFAPENMADPKADNESAESSPDAETGPGEGGGAPGPGGIQPALPGQAPESGLPEGIVPGQAGLKPGGAPDLQTLVAGLRNGNPQLNASVSRRLPTG